MKSRFKDEEKQAILNRYLSEREPPTSIINSVGISKSTFINGYRIINKNKPNSIEKD